MNLATLHDTLSGMYDRGYTDAKIKYEQRQMKFYYVTIHEYSDDIEVGEIDGDGSVTMVNYSGRDDGVFAVCANSPEHALWLVKNEHASFSEGITIFDKSDVGSEK